MKIAFTGSNLFTGDMYSNVEFSQWKKGEKVDAVIINGNIPDDMPDDILVLINSVSQTLKELGKPHWIRFNGWNGFISNNAWEVAGDITPRANELFELLGKSFFKVDDEPGFISPRILAMIINEAFFALEEKVSTEGEIDTAMKLGTNYPKGPFEWAEEIGYQNIAELLLKLGANDKRYEPSQALMNKAGK